MKLKKQFMLSAVLGTVTAAAEDENHWMWSLQFGEPPTLRCVIGKLIVGKNSAWNNNQIAYKILAV
jgi:hypothetical protein